MQDTMFMDIWGYLSAIVVWLMGNEAILFAIIIAILQIIVTSYRLKTAKAEAEIKKLELAKKKKEDD